ncbi:hypothetical protein P4626_19635, partial [Halalkalibacterium halodurans]|uniref:hypothetical protein n=1 Tax=Halalkalibacterium halodurans TaxID=86665 RepID=UPI002E21C11C|nr:hypothetical protein [Halalkalibacterium halodurans]
NSYARNSILSNLFLVNSSIKELDVCVFFYAHICFLTPTNIIEPKVIGYTIGARINNTWNASLVLK